MFSQIYNDVKVSEQPSIGFRPEPLVYDFIVESSRKLQISRNQFCNLMMKEIMKKEKKKTLKT